MASLNALAVGQISLTSCQIAHVRSRNSFQRSPVSSCYHASAMNKTLKNMHLVGRCKGTFEGYTRSCALNGTWERNFYFGKVNSFYSRHINPSSHATRGVAMASLLGVGAPEALVIGVVALLVFGPKGLAEVAKNLGKTLKAFQPTIKELQQVSQEFRNTLEQEIGLDELRQPPPYKPPQPVAPPPIPAATFPQDISVAERAEETQEKPGKAFSAEEYARVTEEQIKALVPEEKRRAAELAAWGGTPPVQQEQKVAAAQPSETKSSDKILESSNAAKSPTEQKPSKETTVPGS